MKKEGQELRNIHKEKRAKMSPWDVAKKSETICRHILQSDWYRNCNTLYAYYPLGKEVDCREIIVQAWKEGKTVALPRTMADYRMEFYQITSFVELTEGKTHLMEPREGCPLLQMQTAYVLVPGVVFDRQGNRYGYGRGYYDRYFARFPGLCRIALGYENQLQDVIEAEETDIKMEYLYTENGMYSFVDGNEEGKI